MTTKPKHSRAARDGFAYVLALAILMIFASLGLALSGDTSVSLTKTSNFQHISEARTAAESGLSFLVYQVTHAGVSASLRGQMLFSTVKLKLESALNGTANLGGATVTSTGSTVTIPTIALDGSRSFSAQVTVPAHDIVRIRVTGSYSTGTGATKKTVQRTVTLDMQATGHAAFGYGVWSKGSITMGMNSEFEGLTFALEGSMYSESGGVAISMGSGHISGDVSVSDPHATVSLGKTTIDGEILYDVPPVTPPTVNRAPFIALATNTLGSQRSGTLVNMRIPANTNPTFGDVTIQGVLYVEAPNVVTFGNSVNLTGVIVADDPPVGSPDSANWISFKNNANFHGVQDLPDTSPFTQVRKLTGTCVLAPGFTLEFKNNLDAAAGVIAIKNLEAKNNLTSLLYGTILVYGTQGLTFKNNSDITVDHSGYATAPAGFTGVGTPILTAQSSTYTEN
jgi:hypothetical protein